MILHLLEGECVVGVKEAETVPACFQIRKSVLTMPVLVAAERRGNVRFELKYKRRSHFMGWVCNKSGVVEGLLDESNAEDG